MTKDAEQILVLMKEPTCIFVNQEFEVCAASIVGRDHIGEARTLLGRNNQDAYIVEATPEMILAVVSDGCGSGDHSEIGAQITTRLVFERIKFYAQKGDRFEFMLNPSAMLERVRRDVLSQIHVMALAMGGSFSAVINNYWLCTIVGVIVTPYGAIIFSLGDGVYGENGQVKDIGPFPENEPPYLAYGLVSSSLAINNPSLLEFSVKTLIPIYQVNRLVIGTDGVNHLVRATGKTIPGRDKVIEPFEQIWENDKFFSNPDGLRRYLAMMNSEVARIDRQTVSINREHGLLPDDTTLVLIRRRTAG